MKNSAEMSLSPDILLLHWCNSCLGNVMWKKKLLTERRIFSYATSREGPREPDAPRRCRQGAVLEGRVLHFDGLAWTACGEE